VDVATRTPDRTSLGWGYDPQGFHDEAFEPAGVPRPAYAALLDALGGLDLAALTARVRTDPCARAATFTVDGETQQFPIDPVPRVFEAAEWARLERGLIQRARALNAFVADVYCDRAIIGAGIVPARTIDGCDYFEPWMVGVDVPWEHATVAGFDVVRGADGRLRVLEDNLRTPSGMAYAAAARRVVDAQLPGATRPPRRNVDDCYGMLAEVLRAAAPDGGGDPSIVMLSDGPSNSAWYEHRTIARRLGLTLAEPADLRHRDGRLYVTLPSGRLREVQVLYRRTDEDRLHDGYGRATWLAKAVLDPLRRGTLSVVNSPGAGVADDKLVHAYVEDMIRFYLGEEPLVESVRTYDLGESAMRVRALGRLGALVIKPRAGHGGKGIVIGPHATREELDRAAAAIRAQPESFVAQETVMLSRHPTVCDGRLEPRHVDLRVFSIASAGSVNVVPGGLTRVALERGSLIVNSSRNGGGKDTWVLA
jgi:uncharacterized circularly permuted ATP-grasp superfamily protein